MYSILNKHLIFEESKLSYYPWLDIIRGLAATLVCFGHIRNAFWVDYSEINIKIWWHVPVYFITGIGHPAVIVFFVLSGFLIGGSILKAGINFKWTFYLQSRIVRLWLVLLPALLFTATCDFLTLHFSPAAFDGIFSQIWNSGPSSKDGFTWQVFLANVFFLQTINFPVFGSNGPLWSLANEFWYYILFPLLFCGFGFVGAYKPLLRLLMLFLSAILLIWLPTEIIFYFLFWLVGVVCARTKKEFSSSVLKILLMVSTGLLLSSLMYSKYPRWQSFLYLNSDICVCVSFSGFLLCLNSVKISRSKNSYLFQILKKFSDFSYSLYLFHFPLVVLLTTLTVTPSKLQPGFFSTFVLISVFFLCVTVAWVNWWIFERNNLMVRSLVIKFCSYISAEFGVIASKLGKH